MHYVIGDVHGCFEEMMCLLDNIDSRDPSAQFIFLGDMIDRGPKVYECLQWALANITPDGKYRMVIGNHEAAVVDWYHYKFLNWIESEGSGAVRDGLNQGKPDYSACKGTPVPHSKFDFSDMIRLHGMDTVEGLEPVIRFFEGLPSIIEVNLPAPEILQSDFETKKPAADTFRLGSASQNPENLQNSWGYFRKYDSQEILHYKIVHAWYMKGIANEKMQRHINIRRRCLNGNQDDSYIIIHGHTPTNSEEFLKQKKEGDRPGRICYRKNAVNLDGGCCFGTDHGYKGMLCAICLETFEEFYAAADFTKVR